MKSILSLLLALIFCAGSAIAGETPRMDKDELKGMLGTEELVLLDVRRGEDWNSSEFKIKGAVRVEDGDLSIAANYPKDSTFVLYCA